MMDNGLKIRRPGKVISDYIKKLILDEETYKDLVIVFHGNNEVNFAHAACFVRTNDYKNSKQMLLLDCKNKTPIVCPKRGGDQMDFEESLKIKEDIEASYYKWEIYAIERRGVLDEIERLKIHNRMMYVLTGDEQYKKVSQAVGATMTNQKIKEDIEASYYKWEIYAIKRRVVNDAIERLKIHNRMMFVLTGDEQYQKESQ